MTLKDYIMEYITYDNGMLYRKGNLIRTKPKGNGYCRLTISIDGEKHCLLTHRVIWFLHYGYFLYQNTDHINGIRHDNRIENLRAATFAQNQYNRLVSKKSKTGIKGVTLHHTGKYYAQIQNKVNGVRTVIQDLFNTIEEAAAWVKEQRAQRHGIYVNNGDGGQDHKPTVVRHYNDGRVERR